MRRFRLAGACFALPRPDPTVINFGDTLRWLTPREIRQELDQIAGSGSRPVLPVGLAFYWTRRGSAVQIGDPLCITLGSDDPPLISVSHETGPDPGSNLVVFRRLSTFLRTAAQASPPRWH